MNEYYNPRSFFAVSSPTVRSQKEKAVAAANEHLQGVAEWTEPKGGMFLWIRVPRIADTKSMIEEKALAKEVWRLRKLSLIYQKSRTFEPIE